MTALFRRQNHGSVRWLAVAALLAVLLSACGTSSSSSSSTSASASSAAPASKPSYCAAVSQFEASVKALPSTNVVKNGTNALKAQLAQIKSNATAAVNALKGEFAPQTTAVKSSLSALAATAKQLTSSPSVDQLKQLKADVSAVSQSAKNLVSATAPKCG